MSRKELLTSTDEFKNKRSMPETRKDILTLCSKNSEFLPKKLEELEEAAKSLNHGSSNGL